MRFELVHPSVHSKLWIVQFWFNLNWLIAWPPVYRCHLFLKLGPRLKLRTLAGYTLLLSMFPNGVVQCHGQINEWVCSIDGIILRGANRSTQRWTCPSATYCYLLEQIFKIKWFYSVKTQQQHTIFTTLIWLHVSVFSRPSSGQYFPVEGTIDAHYTLWDPMLFIGCA
jgi:hypothetical protein